MIFYFFKQLSGHLIVSSNGGKNHLIFFTIKWPPDYVFLKGKNIYFHWFFKINLYETFIFSHSSLIFSFNIKKKRIRWLGCCQYLTQLYLHSKKCENCHVLNVIICSIGNIHCNACWSKSKVHKLGFLWGSTTTNDYLYYWPLRENGLKQLCIWQSLNFWILFIQNKFNPLFQFCVCCKFQLSCTSLVGFQEDIQQFIQKIKRNLNVEGLIAPFVISCNDDI
jgi:hypothetical protein